MRERLVLDRRLNYDHIFRRATTAERSLSFTRATLGSSAISTLIAAVNGLLHPVRKSPWNTIL